MFSDHDEISLRNAWTHFNETCESYSKPGPYYTDDTFKDTGSKVTVRQWRPGRVKPAHGAALGKNGSVQFATVAEIPAMVM